MFSKRKLISLCLLPCLLALFLLNVIWYGEDVSSHTWPTSAGQVIGKEISFVMWQLPGAHGHPYQLQVRFTYELDGNQQQGHTDWTFKYSDDAEAAAKNWPVGKQVQVFHHPSLAVISTIEPGSCQADHVSGMIVFGVVLLLTIADLFSKEKRWH
jgi:hypothetical protein